MRSALSLLLIAGSALANGSRPPKPKPIPLPDHTDTRPVVLNPSSLKDFLLDDNTDILLAANRVHKAKDNLAIARANLLPSINLNVAILSIANPAFLLSSIESLFPFLLPQRWFEMFAQRDQVLADKQAYRIVQMNTYSSALSIYMELLNTYALKEQLEIDEEDLGKIEAVTQSNFDLGFASEADLALTKSQRDLAALRVVQTRSLYAQDIAAMRSALALGRNREIQLVDQDIPPSPAEELPYEDVLHASLDGAPEAIQLDFLERSSKHLTKARLFGFITGFSASASGPEGQNVSQAFKNATGRITFNLGFAIAPTVRLSKRTTQELRIRRQELGLENSRLVEVVLQQLPLAKRRYALASSAETQQRRAFEDLRSSYELGLQTSLVEVLRARIGIQEATLARFRARTDLNLMRIMLHRMLRTYEFERILGCPIVLDHDVESEMRPDGSRPLCAQTEPPPESRERRRH